MTITKTLNMNIKNSNITNAKTDNICYIAIIDIHIYNISIYSPIAFLYLISNLSRSIWQSGQEQVNIEILSVIISMFSSI